MHSLQGSGCVDPFMKGTLASDFGLCLHFPLLVCHWVQRKILQRNSIKDSLKITLSNQVSLDSSNVVVIGVGFFFFFIKSCVIHPSSQNKRAHRFYYEFCFNCFFLFVIIKETRRRQMVLKSDFCSLL